MVENAVYNALKEDQFHEFRNLKTSLAVVC